LPPAFKQQPDGEPYPSGSAYEVLSAIAKRDGGAPLPDIFVFRYPRDPQVSLDDPKRPEIEKQWNALKGFERWFETAGGQVLSFIARRADRIAFVACALDDPPSLNGCPPAAHPVNAILNYAYAALESEIRIKAISEGYDPTIGIMHEGNDGSSKFIFDLMEPERPKVDRAVLAFVGSHVFDPADFVIRGDGVCRLNPEMARMVVARVSA
jgi:CRISPR associated protein Cas1